MQDELTTTLALCETPECPHYGSCHIECMPIGQRPPLKASAVENGEKGEAAEGGKVKGEGEGSKTSPGRDTPPVGGDPTDVTGGDVTKMEVDGAEAEGKEEVKAEAEEKKAKKKTKEAPKAPVAKAKPGSELVRPRKKVLCLWF